MEDTVRLINDKDNTTISKIQALLNMNSLSAKLAFENGQWWLLFQEIFCIVSRYGDVTYYEKKIALLHDMATLTETMGPKYVTYIVVHGFAYLPSEFLSSSEEFIFTRDYNPEVFCTNGKPLFDFEGEMTDKISDDIDDNDRLDIVDESSFYENMMAMEYIINEYKVTEADAKKIIENKQINNLTDMMFITSDGIVQDAIDKDDLKEKLLEVMHAPGLFDVDYVFVDRVRVDVKVDIQFEDVKESAVSGQEKIELYRAETAQGKINATSPFGYDPDLESIENQTRNF